MGGGEVWVGRRGKQATQNSYPTSCTLECTKRATRALSMRSTARMEIGERMEGRESSFLAVTCIMTSSGHDEKKVAFHPDRAGRFNDLREGKKRQRVDEELTDTWSTQSKGYLDLINGCPKAIQNSLIKEEEKRTGKELALTEKKTVNTKEVDRRRAQFRSDR